MEACKVAESKWSQEKETEEIFFYIYLFIFLCHIVICVCGEVRAQPEVLSFILCVGPGEELRWGFCVFFIRYLLYLHFKCYPLSCFPLQKPPIPSSSPCSLKHQLLLPGPGIPLHWGTEPSQDKDLSPNNDQQGHSLLLMEL